MPDLTAWQAVGWALVLAVCLVVVSLALAIGAWFITYAIAGGIAAHRPDPDPKKEPPTP